MRLNEGVNPTKTNGPNEKNEPLKTSDITSQARSPTSVASNPDFAKSGFCRTFRRKSRLYERANRPLRFPAPCDRPAAAHRNLRFNTSPRSRPLRKNPDPFDGRRSPSQRRECHRSGSRRLSLVRNLQWSVQIRRLPDPNLSDRQLKPLERSGPHPLHRPRLLALHRNRIRRPELLQPRNRIHHADQR